MSIACVDMIRVTYCVAICLPMIKYNPIDFNKINFITTQKLKAFNFDQFCENETLCCLNYHFNGDKNKLIINNNILLRKNFNEYRRLSLINCESKCSTNNYGYKCNKECFKDCKAKIKYIC